MNTRNPLLMSGLLAALAIPSLASAAAASHQCSQLWDDELRLTCYDKAFGKPVPPPAETAAAVPPAPASAAPVAAAAAVAAVAAPSSAASASAAPAAVAAPAAAVVAPPVAKPQTAASSKEKPKQPDSLATTVTALSFAPDGRFRATLENGQVWQQLELHPPVQVKAGDRVTLKKASFGSFQLVVPGGMAARVTQLK